jgi:hypothetical protein
LTGEFNPLEPVGGLVQNNRVPVIDLAQEWRWQPGTERIDPIKIDIEGGKTAFLKAHSSFIRGVGAVLTE